MTLERPELERRVVATLTATPHRIPILLGECGSGRTSIMLRVRDQLGSAACQYVDVERTATTPERFLQSVMATTPFAAPAAIDAGPTARGAFNRALRFFETARRADDGVATFLLDEVLELRTFESFPNLRSALRDLVDALAHSSNRFVLTSRYASRALRLLRDVRANFEVIQLEPLTVAEVRAGLRPSSEHRVEEEQQAFSTSVQALGDGRPGYVRAIVDAVAALEPGGGADPVAALVALLAPGGALSATCRFTYELRLHRARGYGALKGILDILAEEEPLTLTEIAQRLQRTPGSTKDYLSWLEDVDLIIARQKRYSIVDPMLRLWIRLHCRPAPPSAEEVAHEVHDYALKRLPPTEPAPTPVTPPPTPATDETEPAKKKFGIIEID